MNDFEGFLTWDDVMKHVRAGKPVYYKAPFDRGPRYVAAVAAKTKKTIRVDPLSRDASKFTADSGHLDRFFHR